MDVEEPLDVEGDGARALSLLDGLLCFWPLAFQVWDVFGWVGQVLFAARVLHQWYVSERAGRSHVTAPFWWYSLAATPFLLVYVFHRKDPVFMVGVLVNAFLYARNLWLLRRTPETRKALSPWIPLVTGLAAFVVVSLAWKGIHARAPSWPWLVVGFTGQLFWTGRFVVQWFVSERQGRSVLPAAFFRISIAGSLLLFVYAVHQHDWVMMAAYAFNPIPYLRNLALLSREGREAS